ncbi:MAG: four helix bundle protein [Bacteroidales bacterium]|nr:four helix bundle protein [Bacteroidales bacterium]
MNDLQNRLVEFAVRIFESLKPLMNDQFIEPVIKQIIKSSTSVGANYSESQASSSYRDFLNKIKIAQKELKETEYWIKYLSKIKTGKIETEKIECEIIELKRIFSTIAKKADLKLKSQNLRPKT